MRSQDERGIHKRDVPQGTNIVGGRFVLSLKNFSTSEETAKPRCFAQGYSDKHEEIIANDAVALRSVFIRIILSIASMKRRRVFSREVTQAYLQSMDDLTRQVYVCPKKRDRSHYGVKEGELLKLVEPIYGLCDSGN